jgi:hypothetical protein
MTKDDIQLRYEYDRWANNRVLQAASALNAEQFTRDLGEPTWRFWGLYVHVCKRETLQRTISRRSQIGYVPWARMQRLLRRWVPLERICHSYPSFRVPS